MNVYSFLFLLCNILNKAQRVWNQELRNHLVTCNPDNHFNYTKSKRNFIPILTTLNHDDHRLSQNTQLHFPTKFNSLLYQFAYIALTDPCLLYEKEMNIDGFFEEQNIHGFSPISLLCQSMMCHELSRISGMLVERFSWIIWYMHCALMKERCTHENASVDWLIMYKIAHSMGYHLKNYYLCKSTHEIPFSGSIISDNINKHIYSRWTPLLLSESVQPNSKTQLNNILQSVSLLCHEIKRYFSPLLPKNSSSDWLFNNLSRSIDYYLMKHFTSSLLIPISYLLFGPAGSLFLDSKFTRQSILYLNGHSLKKSADNTSSSIVSHCVCNDNGVSTNSTLPSVSCSTQTTTSIDSSCYSTSITTSASTNSPPNCYFATNSFNTPSSSSIQFNSNNYSSSSYYSTTSISTSLSDSLVHGSCVTSTPVLFSSMISLPISCTDIVTTTTTTTTINTTATTTTSNTTAATISTSLVNLSCTPPTNSTSTFPTSSLTNQLSNFSLQENRDEESEENISTNFISNSNNNDNSNNTMNYNQFSTQIESLCSKLNDETETSLSSHQRQIYSPFYKKHGKESKISHRSWAKYGLLNPHLVPSCIDLPECLDKTMDLEAVFTKLKNDLSICDVEINIYDSELQYMIRNAIDMIYRNSSTDVGCGLNVHFHQQIIKSIIQLKNYDKIYYTNCVKEFLMRSSSKTDDSEQQFWNNFTQYDLIVIDLLNQNTNHSFHADDDHDDDDVGDVLLLLIQRLQELRFYLPWNELINDDILKGIFVITSTDDNMIFDPLRQYMSWDCVVNFNETTDPLQFMNLELKSITNTVNLHQISVLKSILFNYYLSNIKNDNSRLILCDLFIEAHLLACKYNCFDQNTTYNHAQTLSDCQYSLNYLIQSINVWYYLEYCHHEQNKNQILCNQLNETNLLFDSMRNAYHSLESQITEANSMLAIMRKDLHNYQEIYLPEAKRNYACALERLQYLEKEILRKESELTDMKKPMDSIRKLAEDEFDKLKNAYRLAVQGLHNLSIEDLDEIRSYREPPDDVKDCVYLICMLMNEEENWENAKHMMVPVKFISTILKLSAQSLNKHQHRELRKRLNNSEILTFENLLQVSVAAARLYQWLKALCECCDAAERLQIHINNYSLIEMQLNQNESILGNLHVSLQMTKIDIELANNRLIECEQQIKHLSESINTLYYKIDEAKSLISTIQSNLTELLVDDSNNDVIDASNDFSFWFNILGALGTVYCQVFPVKHRSLLWNNFKNLVWNKMKQINQQNTMNDYKESLIMNEENFHSLQLFKIIQIKPYEIMNWFIWEKKFPSELILTYHNQNIGYMLEAILSIRTMLWSVRYTHTRQCTTTTTSTDTTTTNTTDNTNMNGSTLYLFIYDPDLIGINMIKLLLLTTADQDEYGNVCSNKKDQLISDIYIDANEFKSILNYSMSTRKLNK
ncbi:unnamed protein product [Schistosoma turkestanicum]|nr:unnamed protein product [Schistosoma turkestanicum]